MQMASLQEEQKCRRLWSFLKRFSHPLLRRATHIYIFLINIYDSNHRFRTNTEKHWTTLTDMTDIRSVTHRSIIPLNPQIDYFRQRVENSEEEEVHPSIYLSILYHLIPTQGHGGTGAFPADSGQRQGTPCTRSLPSSVQHVSEKVN